MINQARRTHNGSPRRYLSIAAIVLPMLLALVWGCQPATESDNKANADGPIGSHAAGERHIATRCPVAVTTSAYTAFLDLAQQVAAAGSFDDAAFGRLAQHPVYARWLRSFESPDVTDQVLDSYVARAIIDRSYNLPDQPRIPVSGTYRSMKYDFERVEDISAMIDRFIADETGCRALDLLAGFVRPDRMPDTLRVDFLAGDVEIRNFENHAMIDVGLALALGQTQLAHLLASVIYQDTEFIAGAHPKEVAGAAAVYNTWRVVHNGGMAAWLEDQAFLYFGNDHPRLKSATPVPERIFARGARVLPDLDAMQARLLSDPEALANDGTSLNHYLIGAQAYQATGLIMATLIERHLGVERLQQSCHAVSDFLDAYQEASALNPESPTGPKGRVDYYLEGLRPFSPQTYPALRELVVGQETED